jgi:PIN domain nuclease of toxin-antitoxin system
MVLLDTCALLWWTLDPDRLSPKAKKACDGIATGEGYISSISIWEVGIEIKNKKLDIGISIDEYTQRLKMMKTLHIIPVDEAVWLKNLALDWSHQDPADRTIVATAMLHALPIVTKDGHFKAFYKRIIW